MKYTEAIKYIITTALPQDYSVAYDIYDMMYYSPRGKGNRVFHGIKNTPENHWMIMVEIRDSITQSEIYNKPKDKEALLEMVEWNYGIGYYVKSLLTEKYYYRTLNSFTDKELLEELIKEKRVYINKKHRTSA